MASNSVWRVLFYLSNAAGVRTSGPHYANVGVSGGGRGDQQSHSLALTLATVITNNLAAILGIEGATGTPLGSVVVDTFQHALTPEVFT